MILVDTSVWIDHLHEGVPELSKHLNAGEVLVHPMVIGELACGSLRNREEVLSLLSALPGAVVASHDEVLELIARENLMGRGLGFIDAHLLCATLLTPDARLWTRDKRLATVAKKLECALKGD